MAWSLETIRTSILWSRRPRHQNEVMANPQVDDPARFEAYARQLTLLDDFLQSLHEGGLYQTFGIVDFFELTEHARLPGKNHARIVVRCQPPSRHVFKGFDFETFLHHGPHFHEHQRDTMLREIRTLASLPAHPNIMPCPQNLVVVHDSDGSPRLCGFLQPVMERETLDDQIVNAGNFRIPLALKAEWCYQMSRAILHTHRVGNTYHMDVKPGNMLVDDSGAIRLIDWEQSGVSMFTHPKEVTIDQEAHDVPFEPDKMEKSRPAIVYKPHQGPARKNLPWGYPGWNVFPEWQRTCPRAAELAEVFSLGRVMWMLLEQVEQSPDPTKWTGKSADIPESWRSIVDQCLEHDPNKRPELDDLVAFWEHESSNLASTNQNQIEGPSNRDKVEDGPRQHQVIYATNGVVESTKL